MNSEADYIRDAIAREEYANALAQWSAYASRLREAIDAGALSNEEMAEAHDLFQWSRHVLLGARAHLSGRLQSLEVAAVYRTAPPSRRASVEIRF